MTGLSLPDNSPAGQRVGSDMLAMAQAMGLGMAELLAIGVGSLLTAYQEQADAFKEALAELLGQLDDDQGATLLDLCDDIAEAVEGVNAGG